MNIRRLVLDGLTAAAAACAVLLTGMTLLDRNHGGSQGEQYRQIEDWERFARGTQTIGAQSPVVTIVEWGDYECPACRRLEPALRGILAAYPHEVRLVYRHWPLSIHPRAFEAARASACASWQGRFASYHSALFQDRAWQTGIQAFADLALKSGMPDIRRFEACIASSWADNQIQADIKAVKELGGRGTPTLMINDLLLASVPDSTELHNLIAKLLGQAERTE